MINKEWMKKEIFIFFLLFIDEDLILPDSQLAYFRELSILNHFIILLTDYYRIYFILFSFKNQQK